MDRCSICKESRYEKHVIASPTDAYVKLKGYEVQSLTVIYILLHQTLLHRTGDKKINQDA